MHRLKAHLERQYEAVHHRRYVHPDPLECLYRFDRLQDREVAGLVAAALAYGRASQIVKSVDRALSVLGPLPQDALMGAPPSVLKRRLRGFVHRFAGEAQMAALLLAAQEVLRHYGSLGEGFRVCHRQDAPNVLPGLNRWVDVLMEAGGGRAGHLLPNPGKGSAAKRLHLYLRWMVRRDGVDPGGWDFVSTAQLIVPLDVHMHRIAIGLGLTRRRTPDLKTALEVTDRFKAISPLDPVRYDFSLTRSGIRKDLRAAGGWVHRPLAKGESTG